MTDGMDKEGQTGQDKLAYTCMHARTRGSKHTRAQAETKALIQTHTRTREEKERQLGTHTHTHAHHKRLILSEWFLVVIPPEGYWGEGLC